MKAPTLPRLTHFRMTVDDGVATILIDRADEPINTIGPVIFDDFAAILDTLETDDSIRAAVFGSGKRDFLAGADIRIFDEVTTAEEATEAITSLQELFNRLERLHLDRNKPVVAAIRGAALGGGLEFALACSMRITSDDPKTQLGQPEIRLGILPAGGGTQRLPQLVGIAPALDLILTGKPVRPHKARKMGLVDEIVPNQVLLEVAQQRARDLVDGAEPRNKTKSWWSPAKYQEMALEQTPMGRNLLFKKAKERVLAETKGNYPAPERALEAVRIGVEEGRPAGLRAEAVALGELVMTPQSRALRSVFFATRALKRETWVPEGTDPHSISKVAVLGGGLMGGGIAAISAVPAGATVRIKEIDNAGVGRGLAYVSKVVAGRVARRRLGEFEGERIMNKVTGTTTWTGFANTDLIIEAVFEDLALKQSILTEAEGITGSETVFASNTSSIPITDIAAASSRPETVVGMHYFSPVEKMPLLEVIATDQTADWALATAVEFGKAQGKTVIVVNDGTGFYTSRILGPYTNEAAFLLEDGASVEAIDGAMVRWGFPVGPVLLMDEVGIDVGAKIAPIMIEAFGERMRGPEMMSRLSGDERKGRKNRRGFYEYDAKGNRGDVDGTVYAALGLGPRRQIPDQEIQDRISLAMVNEAALTLQEGILRSARDGDIGAVMGLGFPPFRGGPFWWMDEVGAKEIVARLDALAERFGDRFSAAAILRQHADNGTTFRDE